MLKISRSKIGFTFVILFLLALSATAQKITGTIKDKAVGETLVGATIVEKGTTNGVKTDFNGKFEINLDLSTPKTLVVTFLGYATTEIAVSNSKRYVDIVLSEAISETKTVEITASRLSERLQESPVTVERMNIAAIKETPAPSFYEGLSNLKGVDMTTASMGFKVINTRGFNSTSPVRTLQIIDGMDNQAPGLNFSLGNFVGSTDIDVEGVEIVVGANSATYGANAFNGVIDIATKNPFKYPGTIVQLKGGSRNLTDLQFRHAQVIGKNQNFAFKINGGYLAADDWVADNVSPTDTSQNDASRGKDSYGYDAINTYGDEFFRKFGRSEFRAANRYPDKKVQNINVYRTGYKEKDLADYDTRSIKVSGGLYYKLFKNYEASYTYNFGTGTTVYQGDNRYSIKDIVFQQHKLQLKSDRFSFRTYTTLEDAGNSYDIVYTAVKLLENSKKQETWNTDFRNYVDNAFIDYSSASNLQDSLNIYNELIKDARIYADTFVQDPSVSKPFYEVGTERFDQKFKEITGKSSYLDVGVDTKDVGTKFQDKSSLRHIESAYDFDLSKFQEKLPTHFKIGANYRQYDPNSFGTIFCDTLDKRDSINGNPNPNFRKFREIKVYEMGAFINTNNKFFNDRLNLIFSYRFDKNQNFRLLQSPSFSSIIKVSKNNNIRVTYSTAFRNPTLQDQYLFYNIGRAILTGNLEGKNVILLNDYLTKYQIATNTKDGFSFLTHVAAVKPEQVKTLELGFKGIIGKKLYIDYNAYYSKYKDFLGYVIGIDNPDFYQIDENGDTIGGVQKKPTIQPYRIATNSKSAVYTVGSSIGLNYFFDKYFTLNFNYTYSKLIKSEDSDPLLISAFRYIKGELNNQNINDALIPNFNTPRHKFNLGVGGRDIKKFGFSINYKFVEGFGFTGSPQFTGSIRSYGLLDGQVSRAFLQKNLIAKIGVSNILNNQHYEAYGSPLIGRLAYASLIYELNFFNKKSI